MTHPLFQDFADRKRQVRHYLAIVLRAEKMATVGATSRAQERRLLMLRAGTFLLLYNLIEATTRGAVEAIHDRITTEQVPFENLNQTLRREMIKRFKQRADPAVHHSLKDFPSAFVGVALDAGVMLAGNVDARYIRELSTIYGFSHHTDKDRTWGGSDLVTVKDNRNALSHGRKTYEEVGRDYPSRELSVLTRRSLAYMGEVLANVSMYLDQRGYLRPPDPPEAPVGDAPPPFVVPPQRDPGWRSLLRALVLAARRFQ